MNDMASQATATAGHAVHGGVGRTGLDDTADEA